MSTFVPISKKIVFFIKRNFHPRFLDWSQTSVFLSINLRSALYRKIIWKFLRHHIDCPWFSYFFIQKKTRCHYHQSAHEWRRHLWDQSPTVGAFPEGSLYPRDFGISEPWGSNSIQCHVSSTDFISHTIKISLCLSAIC